MQTRFKKEITLSILNSSKTKTIMLLMILLNIFYPTTIVYEYPFFDGYIIINNSAIYNCIIAILLLLSTINIITMSDTYTNIIIRYRNKKEYYKELVRNVLLVNIIIIIMNNLLLFINLALLSRGFQISDNYIYKMPNYIYMLWILVKKIIVFEMISCVYVFINRLIKFPINVLINLIICLLLWITTYIDNIVTSLKDIYIFYWEYFVFHKYITFNLEILCFIIYHGIYLIILIIMFRITIKKNNDILE